MRSFLLLAFIGLATAFQPASHQARTSTALNFNPFKGFIDSMESGYAGGEDSPYAKIKERDAAKREAEKAAFAEKKSRGFKLFTDIDTKEKKMAETKYQQEDKEDAVSKWAKGQKPGGFKLPWDN